MLKYNDVPRVSIIMGVYNCEKTISEAVDSILMQSYQNWELIICNDGSTDSTSSIIKKYQNKTPKITLIENERNMGLNISLNRCLKKARGEYIARMDGDDISLPNRLEKEVAFLDENPEYSIVSCPMIYFDEKGDFKVGNRSGEPEIGSFALRSPFCHAPCMVRKNAYDTVNGYSESKDKLRVEDWDLWIRMYAVGFKGYNLSTPLYKMRDDRNAYKRRVFINRINEARASIFAVNKLHLSKLKYIYACRPIMVWLMPEPLYRVLHKRKNR